METEGQAQQFKEPREENMYGINVKVVGEPDMRLVKFVARRFKRIFGEDARQGDISLAITDQPQARSAFYDARDRTVIISTKASVIPNIYYKGPKVVPGGNVKPDRGSNIVYGLRYLKHMVDHDDRKDWTAQFHLGPMPEANKKAMIKAIKAVNNRNFLRMSGWYIDAPEGFLSPDQHARR